MTAAEGTTRVRRRGAVVIDNNTVYDTSISYTALGVLAVLLARPDDAPKGYRTLMRPEAGVGQNSILAAFRELREGGYRYQFLRIVNHKVYTDTYIYDTPVSLEMAKRDHFNMHGVPAIDVPDRRKSKGTLARLPDAREPDAREPDAREGHAQRTGSAGVPFSGSPKTVEQINQGADDAENGGIRGLSADVQELPSQPTTAPANDATRTPKPYTGISPEQMERNRRGAALAKAALKGETLPAAEVLPVEAKDGGQ